MHVPVAADLTDAANSWVGFALTLACLMYSLIYVRSFIIVPRDDCDRYQSSSFAFSIALRALGRSLVLADAKLKRRLVACRMSCQ